MYRTVKVLAGPMAGVFALAEIGGASIAVQNLCPDPDRQLCAVPHQGRTGLTAIALASGTGTVSITWSMISISEGKFKVAPAPPPSPLAGQGVSLLVEKPAQPPDKPPGIGRG